MTINELKKRYDDLLRPVFGDKLRIEDDGQKSDWIAVSLDGEEENFRFSMYGVDCVHLYWCNECFIFDKRRNDLVSSDTYGEIVYEAYFEPEQLPGIVTDVILHLKDCSYLAKKEIIKGKIPSGYDEIKDYVILAKTTHPTKSRYQFANITIEYILGDG